MKTTTCGLCLGCGDNCALPQGHDQDIPDKERVHFHWLDLFLAKQGIGRAAPYLAQQETAR